MQFQVVCGKRLPELRAGRNLIVFYYRKRMEAAPAGVEERKTDTGTMKISSAALTALDLLRYPQASGGIDSVATVLAELAPAIDPEELASLSAKVERSVVQRLGYLLDWVGREGVTERLLDALRSRGALRWTELEREALDPDFTGNPPIRNAKWRIVAHRVPDPDF